MFYFYYRNGSFNKITFALLSKYIFFIWLGNWIHQIPYNSFPNGKKPAIVSIYYNCKEKSSLDILLNTVSSFVFNRTDMSLKHHEGE